MQPNTFCFVRDPLKLGKLLWPHVTFYKEQQEIIYSVQDNDETYVPAANMMGKDFVAAFIIVHFFLTRWPCRVVNTSAKDDHLRVLWGEINNFISTSKYPLDYKRGGPLVVNHHDLRKVLTSGPNKGLMCPISYVTGLVASTDSIAAMQGHHVANVGDGIPRTLFVTDESSSVPNAYYQMASTWMQRGLFIGNTWPCANYFHNNIKAGDLLAL